jgi:hypothetical protein
MEPKLNFFPWYDNKEYIATPEEVKHTNITQEMQKYFNELEYKDIYLRPEQKAWYVLKSNQQGDDMRQEYPATPEEAFMGSMQGAYYTSEMKFLRENNRIKRIPYDPKHGVFTWWDLGVNDLMTCLFLQYINGEYRFIDYHEGNDEGWAFYANMLSKKGYNYIRHHLPHDGKNRVRVADGVLTDKQMAQQVGIRPVEIIKRTKNTYDDIRNYCKPVLKQCFFDVEKCDKIITHLDNYRRKWSKSDAMFSNDPLHDEASHGADAYRTFAVSTDLLLGDDAPPIIDDYLPPSVGWMG